jgi:hypothetical protein
MTGTIQYESGDMTGADASYIVKVMVAKWESQKANTITELNELEKQAEDILLEIAKKKDYVTKYTFLIDKASKISEVIDSGIKHHKKPITATIVRRE